MARVGVGSQLKTSPAFTLLWSFCLRPPSETFFIQHIKCTASCTVFRTAERRLQGDAEVGAVAKHSLAPLHVQSAPLRASASRLLEGRQGHRSLRDPVLRLCVDGAVELDWRALHQARAVWPCTAILFSLERCRNYLHQPNLIQL